MEEVPKHPGGRPTKYRPEYCEQLITHMSQGMTFTSFGGVIGVSKDTLFRWVKEYPEFSDSKRIGLTASENYLVELAHSQMIDGKLNNTAWVFMMKNMHGWRDKIEQENTNHNIAITIDKQDAGL